MVKTKASQSKSKYAIAYFSSQINAEENADLEIDWQQVGDSERKVMDCRTRNGVHWLGRRDAGLLRATRLVLLSRCRATGRVSVADASADAFRFLPACVLADPADADAAATAAASKKRKRSAGPAIPQSPAAAATAMYEEFGSTAKKRRIAEARRLNASVSVKELKAVVASATKRLERPPPPPAEVGGSPAAASQQLLPPRDPQARQPAGVYGPDAVCPPRLRAALLPEAELLAASGPADWARWRGEAAYPDALVLQRLPQMPTEPAARLSHCVRLAMLACLRRFHGLGYRQVNRKGPLPDLPEEVAAHLLEHFTAQVTTSTGQHRALPPTMKDKQLVHMIILCLQLDGYSTDTVGLMSEFRLTAARLTKLLKLIGCDVVTERTGDQRSKVARLRAPGAAS